MVERRVLVCHPPNVESLLENLAAVRAGKLVDPLNCLHRICYVVNNETRLSVIDDFRNRSSTKRDHRSSACHRFNNDQPEWFRPVDREQQRARPSQKVRFLGVADFADKLDPRVVKECLELSEIFSVRRCPLSRRCVASVH